MHASPTWHWVRPSTKYLRETVRLIFSGSLNYVACSGQGIKLFADADQLKVLLACLAVSITPLLCTPGLIQGLDRPPQESSNVVNLIRYLVPVSKSFVLSPGHIHASPLAPANPSSFARYQSRSSRLRRRVRGIPGSGVGGLSHGVRD